MYVLVGLHSKGTYGIYLPITILKMYFLRFLYKLYSLPQAVRQHKNITFVYKIYFC